MKNALVLLFTICMIISAKAQVVEAAALPKPVKAKFDELFPKATAVTWKKTGASYEADFKIDVQVMSATINADGTYIQKELKIATSNLPEASRNYLEQHYSGKPISNAAKVTKPNGTIYYKATAAGTALTFDAAGNYIPTKAKPVKKAKAK